tara:strand:+ start:8602 stop:12408 length:3807 start_codon:yes stop_codon:yes gene_type:complete
MLINRLTYFNEELTQKLDGSQPTILGFQFGEADIMVVEVMTGGVVVDKIVLPVATNVEIVSRNGPKQAGGLSLNIDYYDIITEQMGLTSGEYDVRTHILRNPIYPNEEVRVDDISRNKTEIRLDGWTDDEALVAIRKVDPDSMKTMHLVHEKEGVVRLINWMVDTHYQEASIIVKGAEKFPKGVRKGDTVAIYDDLIDPWDMKISIQLEIQDYPEAFVTLKGPNWNIEANKSVGSPTELESWDDILSSNQNTANSIVNEIFSGSISSELNVDYSDFSKFVHFSSAEERLENFKYKLQLIESYTDSKSTFTYSAATESIQFVSQSLDYDNKISGVKGTFDGYEKYLYYHSGSTYTDTYGTHLVADWPKSYSFKPYTPLHTTSSAAIAWFNTRKIAAQDYDSQNDTSLRSTIPLHVKLNSENNGYVMFVDMVAQHFDDIYAYIDQLKLVHDKTEGVNQGLSKDMLFDVLSSFGWKPEAGFGVTDLWEYFLGTNETGGDSIRDRVKNGKFDNSGAGWTTSGAGSVTGGYGQVGGAGAYSAVTQQNVLEIGKRYKVTLDIIDHEGVNDPIGINNGGGSTGGWTQTFPTVSNNTTVSVITPVVQYTTSLVIYKASATDARWTKFDNVTCREVTDAELEMYPSGAELNTVGNETLPVKDLELEPWKRILNNLPYLLKTKGTRRGIKALMSCYGIPSTILKIQEFGGSDPDITGVNNLKEINQPSYALNFEAEDSHLKQESGPAIADVNTLELRFRHKGPAARMSLVNGRVGSNIKWQLATRDSKIEFAVYDGATCHKVYTPILPLHDNDWWSIFLTLDETTHDYTLCCQKAPDHADGSITHTGKVVLNLSSVPSGWSAANQEIHIGVETVLDSATYDEFTGQMQEFRLWDKELGTTILDVHTKAPISILGNSYSSSYDNLLYRLPMGANTVKTPLTAGSAAMDSLHPNQSTTYAADIVGSFTWSYIEEDYFTPVPNSIGLRGVDSKIRVEDNDNNGDLHPFESRDKSSNDRNPIDSNLLFVGFSPQDELDTDIALQFGGLTVDDIVGDPRDKFKSEYQGLKQFRDAYFKKYNGKQNLWAYMRIIQFFNTALFKQIESMLPARANKIVGLIIKPSLLERPKMVTEPRVSYLDLHLRSKIDYDIHKILKADDLDAVYVQLKDGAGADQHKDWTSFIPSTVPADFVKGDEDGVMARAHDTRMTGRFQVDGNDAAFQPQDDFTGFRNLVRDGCKMTSLDFNVDSPDTIDGKAVVQVFETNPNRLISDDLTYDGQIKVV